MPFEMTSTFIKWLVEGDGCKVSGIYNPDENKRIATIENNCFNFI